MLTRGEGMLAGLLPVTVAVAESAETRAGPSAPLFPAEEAIIQTAGPRRRAEFAAGRRCARAALAVLGLPTVPILPGHAGQPLWPDRVTGSITRCAGYLACAVARVTDVAGIGIDAEPDAALPPGLIESVAGRAEVAWIARQASMTRQAVGAPTVCWDRLLFSAKEAVSKLWYPLTGQWLGFSQVAVFPAADGTFAARPQGRAAMQDSAIQGPAVLRGRWRARGGLIVTAVTWPREDDPGED
jgi:4'-phosphopantetheinyl transferase EntD